MKDFDVPIEYAARAAEEAAKKPIVQELLELSCCDAELPAFSTEGQARLLDIAILTGQKEASTRLAMKWSSRPLRRWRGDQMGHLLYDRKDTVISALWAGSHLQSCSV